MPNPYFEFKQFTVYQDQCTMKVSTDSCILGAWFAEKIPSPSSVLDIGSGTGLLMLMLAQKNKVSLDGIEIDLPSFKQLQTNISNSKWKDSISVFPGDVRNFSFPHKYDFIISNPPFYEGDLRSPAEDKNVARHSKELTLQDLLGVIDRNLGLRGRFGVLLPYRRKDEFLDLAGSRNFHLQEELSIRQTSAHTFFRVILEFSRDKSSFTTRSELAIQSENGAYTEEFIELMKDYYLYL